MIINSNSKEHNILKQKAIYGMIWKLFEKFGVQLVQFVIQIFLARLLLPSQYGIVGLLSIFIIVSDVFIQQGFTVALIQKKEVDQVDYSSIYYLNIILATIIYGFLFILAPYIALFYGENSLTELMRVLSLNVLVGSFCAVQNAIVIRQMEFQKSFIKNAVSVLVQGGVGIILAYKGFGAWALVISKVVATFVGTIILCVTVRWKPNKFFSLNRINNLFSFSSRVLITNLLNTLFNNIHSLIIGRYYSSEALGFYQRGQQMPQIAMNAIDGSFNEVLYPTLVSVQEDKVKIKNVLRRSMKTSMYVVTPMLVLGIVIAEPLTKVLLTEKWLPCVPYIRLQCIICLFWPLSARTHAINAIGKSDITLKLSIITKLLTLLFICLFVRVGIFAIMVGTIVALLISFWVVSYFVNRYIGYSFKETLQDIAISFVLSFFMGGGVFCLTYLKVNDCIILLCQILFGGIIYIGGSVILKIESFQYILTIILLFLSKLKNKSNSKY